MSTHTLQGVDDDLCHDHVFGFHTVHCEEERLAFSGRPLGELACAISDFLFLPSGVQDLSQVEGLIDLQVGSGRRVLIN